MSLPVISRRGVATLLAAVLMTSGCTFLRETIGLGPVRPKVKLVGVEVAKASLSQLDLLVALRVDNPNRFALELTRLRYELLTPGQRIAKGSYDEKVSIPASGHGVVKLPVAVDAAAVLKLAEQVLNRAEDVDVTVRASADFLSSFGTFDLQFEDTRPLSRFAGL